MKSKLIFAVLIGLCLTLTNCGPYVHEFIEIDEHYREGILCVEPNPFDATDSVLCFNEYPSIYDDSQKDYETEALRASETVKFILLNNEGKPISIFDSTGVRMDTIVTYWDFYDLLGTFLDTIYYVHFYPFVDFNLEAYKKEDTIRPYHKFVYRNQVFEMYFYSIEESLLDSLPCPSPNGPIHAMQKPIFVLTSEKEAI